jgi:hypothetical protein
VSPYNGWRDKQSHRYFRGLLRAIGDAKITPVSSAIDLCAWWEFSPEERRKMTTAPFGEGRFRLSGTPTRPYYLPFGEVLIGTIYHLAHKDPDLGVYFSFDENGTLQRHAHRVYRYIKERAKLLSPPFASRMKGIVFQSDTDNIGLQAADLLAYAWFQALTRRDLIYPELCEAVEVFCQKDNGDEATLWCKDRMKELLAPDGGRRGEGPGTQMEPTGRRSSLPRSR